MRDVDLDCANKVWAVLPALMRAIAAHWRQQEPHLDMTMWQIKALKCVKDNTPTVGDLAREFLVSAPTVTRLLDNLVERGLVERREDLHDRRVVRLLLTATGEEVFQKLERRALQCVEEIMVGLEAEDKERVIEAMDILRKALQRLSFNDSAKGGYG